MKKTKMQHCHAADEKKNIISRLNRIEGQVRGLQGMIEEDRLCIDILRQISSVSGAIHGVWLMIVENHLKGCISAAIANKDDSLVKELIEHLKKVK